MPNIIDEWKNLMVKIDKSYQRTTILNETRNMLNESQESKSIDAAKKLVMQRLNWDNARADQFVRNELRHDLPALRSKEGGKFILGCTRMFVDQELKDATTFGKLNTALTHAITPEFYEKFDRNLNNLHVNDFLNQMQSTVDAASQKTRDEVNAQQYNSEGRNGYKIVTINSFEEAQEYGKYTSWCVTHSLTNYESYTKNGYNQFYFCLKEGFENVQKVKSKGCPLDEYGLSMIAISVDPQGELATCTCRWNHDNGGNDNIMNPRQISDLLGLNFYDTFKPNDSFQKIAATLEEIEQKLKAGTPVEEIFYGIRDMGEGMRRVIFKGSQGTNQNILTSDNTFLFKNMMFEDIRSFSEGLAAVQNTNGKWNFTTKEGQLISDIWFENVYDFHEGFAIVTHDHTQNEIDDFDEYYGNGDENFLGRNGNLLLDEWFDDLSDFHNGFAKVYSEAYGGYNLVDKTGAFLYTSGDDYYDETQWLLSVENFDFGWAAIEDNDGNANFINSEGEMMFSDEDNLPDCTYSFQKYKSVDIPLAKVKFDGLGWNYVTTDGQLVYKQQPFFNSIQTDFDVNNGLAIVEFADGKFNYMRPDGSMISKQNFDQYTNFFGKNSMGIAFIKLGGKLNLINRDGQILYPNMWFDSIKSQWTPDPNNASGLGKHSLVTMVNGQWYEFDKETGKMTPTEAPEERKDNF